MYVNPDFPTKKALVKAVRDGATVTVFQPGPFAALGNLNNGDVVVEGPHYPKPHSWYAAVRVTNGKVTKVLK